MVFQSVRIFHSLLWPTQSKALKVQSMKQKYMFFWNSLAFSMIQQMLSIWSLVPLPFLNSAWTSGISWFTYCWSLAWTILMDLWKLCHIHTSLLRSAPQSTGKPHFLHFTLLQFSDGAFFFLDKLKFYGNNAWSKSISAFYSAAFAHLLFLCHAVVILTYFDLFHYYYILWFSRWESKFVEKNQELNDFRLLSNNKRNNKTMK